VSWATGQHECTEPSKGAHLGATAGRIGNLKLTIPKRIAWGYFRGNSDVSHFKQLIYKAMQLSPPPPIFYYLSVNYTRFLSLHRSFFLARCDFPSRNQND
jgi:hypothetical protein